jgi:hypothetical protein
VEWSTWLFLFTPTGETLKNILSVCTLLIVIGSTQAQGIKLTPAQQQIITNWNAAIAQIPGSKANITMTATVLGQAQAQFALKKGAMNKADLDNVTRWDKKAQSALIDSIADQQNIATAVTNGSNALKAAMVAKNLMQMQKELDKVALETAIINASVMSSGTNTTIASVYILAMQNVLAKY